MAEFEKSRWADQEFSQNFRDDADIYLPFRYQFIETAKSLYAYFYEARPHVRILDLGCGDGLFAHELLKTFSPAKVSLLDGSQEMLQAAKKRLSNHDNINFVQASFQDLLAGKSLTEEFDFIYSSLAIHHLPLQEKKELYVAIYKLLRQGGCFVHYDVVAPRSAINEKWYLSLWKQWVEQHSDAEKRQKLLGIPEQYKGNPDNIPDTLESQLEILNETGFKEVDCYFKYGIFSLFGGFK